MTVVGKNSYQNGFRPSNNEVNNPLDFVDSEKRRIEEGIEVLKKEIKTRWSKMHEGVKIFSDLISKNNPYVVDFLLSFELVDIYDEIAQKNRFDRKQRDILPRIIWKAFLSEKIEELPDLLKNSLQLSEKEFEFFLKMIDEKILNKLRELNTKKFSPNEVNNFIKAENSLGEKNNLQNISLSQALKDYKNLGEQLITSGPLKLRIFPERVRPSIKNWIADYYDNLGAGKHGTIERGNYLFHTENARKLNSIERRRLAEVLKSIDDDSSVLIDPENQKIIFKSTEEKKQVFKEKSNLNDQSVFSKKESNRDFFAESLTSKSAYNFKLKGNEENFGQKNVDIKKDAAFNGSEKNISEKKWNEAGGSQDHYEIPGKENNDLSVTKNAWNPAENVRKRMANEDTSSWGSKINQEDEKKSKDSMGSIRFSSPQTFPTEKQRESLKKIENSNNAYSSKESFSTSESKPAFKINSQENDDLMERIRNMKKQTNQNTSQQASYKITPIRSLENNKKESIYQDEESGPKINGNVVDLRS